MASLVMTPEYRAEGSCPVCSSTNVTAFVEILGVPVHCNLLRPTRDQAIHAPKGDIRLGFCARCGHIFNLAFDPQLIGYTQAYENSLHFSPFFQSYANGLATSLIERYRLYGKTMIEIGCGKGEFLKLLCKAGGNHGIGFDPSYVQEGAAGEFGEDLTFVQDCYSERYSHYKADFLCCRHVLEHVTNPIDFLATIKRGCNNSRSTVFFEVPNALFALKDLSIWDIIYEHFSYFSLSSLVHLFASCGFDIHRAYRSYENQFLCIEASIDGAGNTAPKEQEDSQDVVQLAASFAKKHQHKIMMWHSDVKQMIDAGQRVVIWGAGSKGITFLNNLQSQGGIDYVVDINPLKQGMFVAGTGQQIISPEFLRGYRPNVVIVMNSIYLKEIRQLIERLGLEAEFKYA